MKIPVVMLAILLLAGCSSEDSQSPESHVSQTDAGKALDAQAEAVGILPDKDNLSFAGRYEVRSELGTDKFCAVSDGDRRFQIGVLAVFGPESKCEARGSATVDGENIHISLSGEGSCAFDAKYDGSELRFSGSVPAGCAAYCSPRASLSGTAYYMVEQGDDKARRTLGRDIDKLCG